MGITANRAKQIVGDELLRLGYPGIKLRSRTIQFTDLLRERCVFVEVWNFWHEKRGFVDECPDCQKQAKAWQAIKELASANGFRVQSRNTPRGS